MELTKAQLRYLIGQQGVVPALVNFTLNSGIASVVHDKEASVSLQGPAGSLLLWAPALLIPALTCLLVVPAVRADRERGRIAAAQAPRWLVAALPQALGARTAAICLWVALLFAAPLQFALQAADIRAVAMPIFAWWMGAACALLAVLVTPLLALRTLHEPELCARQPGVAP